MGAAAVKGVDRMLTAAEVAEIIRKPVKFVRDKLLVPGVLKGIKLGGNGWRVRPSDLDRFIDGGATGFRSAGQSGLHMRGRQRA